MAVRSPQWRELRAEFCAHSRRTVLVFGFDSPYISEQARNLAGHNPGAGLIT